MLSGGRKNYGDGEVRMKIVLSGNNLTVGELWKIAAEGAAVAIVARTAEPGGKLAGSLRETATIRRAGTGASLIAVK